MNVRVKLEVLCRETTDFISPDLWPTNSPDLNPVDYQIWAVVHQRGVYQRKIHTNDELKQRLIEVWCGLKQSTVNMAVDQWRKRLRACVRAKGGHFEHSLLNLMIVLTLSTFCHLLCHVLLTVVNSSFPATG